MKRHRKTMQHLAALMLGVLLILGHAAQAADNTGTGDVAGDPTALTDSNVFQLFSTPALTLVKTAFLTVGGTQLTSGDTLPAGTLVDFMIYVDNKASIGVTDVTIQDVLDPLFAYQAGTIRVDNSVANCAGAACTPAEEAAIYAAAAAAAAGTDLIDAPDTVSFNGGTTVDAGNQNVANGQLDAAANAVLAVVFTVQVQ
ncbi:MAG: hypothetical protein ACE5FV_12285 [Woeseia sp.]